MSNQEVILEYKGAVTFEKIDSLLIELKAQPAFRDFKKTDQKRAYSIIVECLENIYKHSFSNPPDGDEKVLPYFIFGRQEDKYIVSTGNLISNNEINELKNELEQINRLNRDELKASFEEIINKEPISNAKGAGLGLIIIALKSKNKIKYNISSIDKNYSFFEMTIIISHRSDN